jgi:hypothetical protein
VAAEVSSSGAQEPSRETIRAAFGERPLGILVTRRQSGPLLEGLVAAATRAQIGVRVFFMDDGVRLLADHQWVRRLAPASLAACDLSVRTRGVVAPGEVSVAGQYQNALMVRDAARVVSL